MTSERADVVERGDIFFLYRPRVNEDDPSGLSDVQRFFMVLRPDRGKIRLLVVGRKRLPDPGRHERNWGFVAKVAQAPAAIEQDLREETYETKTRGERRQPAARPAGEGRYAVALIDGQMHLAYVLERPEQPAEVQRAFRIAPEASFALSVNNPEADSPPGTGLGERQEADYPERLQREFRGRRFDREDVRLLDAEGAEFILVGTRTDPEAAYRVDLDAGRHADILRELQMAKSRHPIRPLFEGKWA
jgi:hypothetical protein